MATFNFDNLLKISFAKNLKGIFFIQIGACDGKSRDPIHKYIINYKWKGILVEPVKYLFARLVDNYKDVKENLIFENIAIAEKNEVRNIYRYKEDQRDLPSWYEGTASLLLNFEGRHKGAISGIKERLVTERVRCVTFENLLQKYDIKNIDLLVIDTEGYDFNIIRSIDFGLIKPRAIFYENQCLSRNDNLRCRHFLTKKGYGLIDLGVNTLALCSKSMMIKVHLNLLGHELRKLLISLRSRGGTKLRRIFLSSFLFLYNIRKKEDVAVVEAVKNISDLERIINNFESIRRQDYDQDLVHITLVDYDSDIKLIPYYQEMCRKYNAKYIRVDNKPIWNRAHALNIGIKRAKTKYILCTDIDIVFERNYVKEAIGELRKDPLQIVISPLLDLPDILVDWKEYSQLKPLAKIRSEAMDDCAGTNLALTYFYRKIRGYDEQYKLWGAEDADLIKRFRAFALKIKSIEKRTSYLHQYHSRYRNLKEIDGFEKQVVKNRVYFANSASIVRNAGGWGNPGLFMGDASTEKTRLLRPSVCLLPAILLYRLIKREDITVIVPVKNIDGKYLINSLKSIREQIYDQSLIDIMLIDYNSGAEFALLYKKICAQYRARYIRIDNRPVWHKTNAFNIGIKMTKTKYILTADVDMIFEKNYIWEAVKELKRDPFQVIVNAALDLSDIPIEDKNYDELKLLTTPRYNLKYMNGITLTFTCFYHKLRGYDEEYKVWGSEDDDLIKRFKLFGLAAKPINDRTSYLHQYHERYRGVKDIKRLKDIIALNRHYFNSTNSIVRNRKGWGE